MTNSDQNPLDWHRRLAAMELRISRTESRLETVDHVIEPDGWIGEAFNVLESHVDQHLNAIDQRLDSMDGKLDTIMRHITGMNEFSPRTDVITLFSILNY
jgi:hypothetical protein